MCIVIVINFYSEQEAVAAVVDKELSEQLQAGPFYSILIDESTDIATDHTLTMYV